MSIRINDDDDDDDDDNNNKKKKNITVVLAVEDVTVFFLFVVSFWLSCYPACISFKPSGFWSWHAQQVLFLSLESVLQQVKMHPRCLEMYQLMPTGWIKHSGSSQPFVVIVYELRLSCLK
jgi:hypothetical protein